MKDIATIISFTMELPYLFASLKTIHNWHVKVQKDNIESTTILGSNLRLTLNLFL
jgi:hypothetical protein